MRHGDDPRLREVVEEIKVQRLVLFAGPRIFEAIRELIAGAVVLHQELLRPKLLLDKNEDGMGTSINVLKSF